MSNRQKEIVGLILITYSLLSVISLFGHDITESPNGLPLNYKSTNYLGFFGVWVSHYHYILLGYTSIIFPIIFAYIGGAIFLKKDIKSTFKLTSFTLITGLYFSTTMSFFANISDNLFLNNYFSGFIGLAFSTFLFDFSGFIGTSTILFLLQVMCEFFFAA